MDNNEKIKTILAELGLLDSAVFDFNLASLSSFKAGGRCTCFLRIDSRDKLIPVLKKLNKDKSIEIFIIGGCTNVLFNDGSLDILVIQLGKDFDYIDIKSGSHLKAGASVNLQKFIVSAAGYGYDFSFAAGIPGTVGGAVAGNSGAEGICINEKVEEIRYLVSCDKSIVKEKIKKITSSDISYRMLKLKKMILLTDIYFKIPTEAQSLKNSRTSKEEILKKIRDRIKEKKNKQPVNLPGAGCFFKNPANACYTAGELIDRCGLKGFRFGGASVSEKHANFINSSNASARDIHTLSEIIKQYVKDKYNINLENEVKLVGFK